MILVPAGAIQRCFLRDNAGKSKKPKLKKMLDKRERDC